MTTEKQSDNTEKTSNKTVFGPLGKYAVISVIMVSIIVTTAIMLDKQLNTAERNIAVIESEVAALNTTVAAVVDIDKSTTTDTVAVAVDAETKETTDTVAVDTETKETPDTIVAETEITLDQSAPAETQEITAQQDSSVVTAETAETAETVTTAATIQETVQDNQTQFTVSNNEQQFKDRIAAYKAEQKQRMADMFARIKSLESQQLDQYKANQEKQIARLRNQISHQQEMIDALVLRNKDSFELRAANVQRIQTNREKVLNRI